MLLDLELSSAKNLEVKEVVSSKQAQGFFFVILFWFFLSRTGNANLAGGELY